MKHHQNFKVKRANALSCLAIYGIIALQGVRLGGELGECMVSRQRKKQAQAPQVLTVDGLCLNLETRELQNSHGVIHLTPKECQLLATFMRHPNRVLSRRFLMREVWETDYIGDTRTLQVHVSWLRRKIEENPRRPTRLRTVRGVGYRFGAQL